MSPSSFQGLLEILGRDACMDWLKASVAAAIGDVTAQAMERLGRTPDLVADSPSVDTLLAAVAEAVSGRPAGGGR
jgi:uroporphyrinogen-III synthase